MSQSSDQILQEIVASIGVKSFLQTYCNINARHYTSSALILCLWHSESNPSLGIYLNSGKGVCFACHERVSLIKIYSKVHDLSHAQAVEKLLKHFGGSYE